MKKIKSYFSSHKKILLTTLLLIVLLGSISFIIGSYATNVLTTGNDGEYDITLTDEDNTISIPAHSAKTVYYKVENTTNGIVSYGVGYSVENYNPNIEEDTSLGVYVKAYNSDDITGTFDYHEYKFIKLKVYNQTDTDYKVELSTILGYEEGGDLVMGDVNLIDDIISSDNAILSHNPNSVTNENSLFLDTGLVRKNIANITIASDSIVPTGFTNYIDLSVNEDKSIIAWWKENDENNTLVDLYIGSDYGKVFAPESSKRLFANLSNIENIDLSNLDTSDATNMTNMFSKCSNLTSLDLSSLDTSNAIDMTNMFVNCSSLTSLDLSNWDTSNVGSMAGMFGICSSLTSLDLSNFSASNVTTTQQMFQGCTSLANLNLSGFDFNDFTTNGTVTTSMFKNVTANIKVSSSEQKTAFESLFTTYDSNKVIFN